MKKHVQETYELDENDLQLLKRNILPKPYEYDHHDASFCGSPACTEWDNSVKPFKDAGLFEFMMYKKDLMDALSVPGKKIPDGITLADAVTNFLTSVPEEIQIHMGLNLEAIRSYDKRIAELRKEEAESEAMLERNIRLQADEMRTSQNLVNGIASDTSTRYNNF